MAAADGPRAPESLPAGEPASTADAPRPAANATEPAADATEPAADVAVEAATEGSPALPEGPAIRVRGLTKHYGSLAAVDHLDLEVAYGEVFGLLGPNGAGKTTTILMLLGLTEPTAGQAEVTGLDPRRDPLEVKRRVGYLPDNVGFYGGMTGRENLRYTARLNRIERQMAEARIDELLERVGLADAADKPVEQYSRGMRQRLGLADTLVKDPAVVILDEPTIAIDPKGVVEVLELVRWMARDRGAAVLLSSHLLYQVQQVCDRVGIFVAGRLVAVGPMQQLADELAAGPVVLELSADGDPESVRQVLTGIEGVSDVRRDERDGTWVLSAASDLRPVVSRELAARGIGLWQLRRRGDELDEIYRRYFAAHEGDMPAEVPDGAAA
ncbi:MAG TPA: ABC transporter ATP-binding protein [Candidatus Limnocylindrales bacterium]|nr:ABC transporter ATP-binding protein [Candidatus Limnocylindrales bacterium]